MGKSIEDLDRHLEDIFKTLKDIYKVSSGSTGGSTRPSPKTLQQHFQQAGSQNLKETNLAKNLASKSGTFASGASSMAGSLSSIVGPYVAIGVALAAVPRQVQAFAESLHDANRQFSQFSVSMAMVMQSAEINDIMRSMRKGESLAGSASDLARGRERLNMALEPMDIANQSLSNKGGEFATDLVSTFLEESGWNEQWVNLLKVGEEGIDFLRDLLHMQKKSTTKIEGTGLGEWAQAVATDAARERGFRKRPLRPGQDALDKPKDPRPNFDRGIADENKGGGGF